KDRVAHLVPGAEPRFTRSSGPCPRRTTGPGRRKAREHLVAPRLFALLVSHPVALPIELRPGVALFGLDAAAELNALARKLHEEPRQLPVLRKGDELFGERPELLDVRPALLSFFGAVLEVCLVSRESGDRVEQPRQRELLRRAAKLRHDLSEGDERVLLPFGDGRDEVRLRERVTDAHVVLACGREQGGARLVAQ